MLEILLMNEFIPEGRTVSKEMYGQNHGSFKDTVRKKYAEN
jgi:hypothetical protein